MPPTCEICGAPFKVVRVWQRFCTRRCFEVDWNRRRREHNRARLRRQFVTSRPLMTQAEIGYLAGIIDGEGCLVIIKDQRYPDGKGAAALKIQMTDEDVIIRIREIVGAGSIYYREKPGPRSKKPSWTLQISGRQDMARVLCAVAPLMSHRRRSRIMELSDVLS